MSALSGLALPQGADHLGQRLAAALRRRAGDLRDAAGAELGRRPIEVLAETVGTARALERQLGKVGNQLAGRDPITSNDEWAALMLPSNVVAGAAQIIAMLLVGGNRVLARMTGRAPESAGIIQAVFDDVLRGAVAMERSAGGPEFLEHAVSSASVPFAMVFGGEELGDDLLRRARQGLEKRILFEGPGKDPVIVLPDARVVDVARAVARAKLVVAGQRCVSPENVLVHASLHDQLVEGLVAAFDAAPVGDPREPTTAIGPLMSHKVPPNVEMQLADALRLGASIACGGRVEAQWVHPTIVTGVTPEMRLFQDETFAPVLAVVPFGEIAEAVELAQAGRFGLACSVFGPSAEPVAAALRGETYAHPVDDLVYGRYGHVTIDRTIRELDLREPTGGYGKSGWIWDRDGLRQGPKSVAIEGTVRSRDSRSD